ncbi:MAG: glycosyltransferase [Deltaproteobacteria bacterium]|nr:glycosyltransferase [Deltaproteobacteria bacterium]
MTVDQSIGDYWSDDTLERRRTMDLHLSRVLSRAKMGDIDVIHTHDAQAVEFIYDGVFAMHLPIVMTLHVPAKESRLQGTYQRWCNPLSSRPVYCVPISEYQKGQYNGLVKTEDVVYHGIEVEEYPLKAEPDRGSYLFTIGRVTADKGQDKAIEIAKKTCSKLVIAGCIQNKAADREFFAGLKNSIDLLVEVGKYPVDNDYYNNVIGPLLDCDKQIIYIGEINSEHKKKWYRHARATLFPIQWDEPFGLVLIESMACGTPAIAFNRGAVPEIMVDGKTGFIVDCMSDMAGAVDRIDHIDPDECRRHVENRFSTKVMACGYSRLYQEIAGGHRVSDRYRSFSIGDLSRPLHGRVQARRKPCPKTFP